MPNSNKQIDLAITIPQNGMGTNTTTHNHQVKLALTLDHREWLGFLADEWWPLNSPDKSSRLGVGTPRDIAVSEDKITVVAWIDSARLPQVEVLSWRANQWLRVSLADVGEIDEEVVWPGPLPLFAVSSFSVVNQLDKARLLAMSRGFSNISAPTQPIHVERYSLKVSTAQQPPDQKDQTAFTPSQDWNSDRGAAAMAVWAVPAVAPWLDVLCESLDLSTEGFTANRLGAAWWSEPPWRSRPSNGRDVDAHNITFWRATVDVLRAVRMREAWRPLQVLDEIRERALSNGITRSSLEELVSETRELLNDERTVRLDQRHFGALGAALQLVLLRPTPERFITWTHELRALPPVIWWTGAMLSGLVQGYRDLEPRFRGMTEGRSLLAIRTLQLSNIETARIGWPGASTAKPKWSREAGKVRLYWDDKNWAERSENSRGRWFAANLEQPDIRRAAIDVAQHFSPTCLRQRLRLKDQQLAILGAGVVQVETKGAPLLVINGAIELNLPVEASITTEIDDDSFRQWLIHEGIVERLPEPPLVGSTRKLDAGHRDTVPGLVFVPDFISAIEEREILATIDAAPWRDDMKRRVQHYGWAYNYKAKKVEPKDRLGPLPEWAEQIGARLVEKGFVEELPDQVIVNEYVVGQGISKHVDCPSCFRGAIVTISLSESWEMFFWSPEGRKTVLTLDRRSATIIGGDAREKWKHEIPKRLNEPWGPRGRRVSLTFRKVDIHSHKARHPSSR
ncbi:alpha-ketoglutarate-dependent dioxygenase AlkB [Melittangium boletus]|uniref:Fe2OG dioxygenase domain-containing protein n=1 Tax=Melittangium boletus DSM 14713 TaxID=1294270 RepID=A0A250IM18_9BACT|nr:alpha-ketoglutarate-dependent dioxygenase AlkB [Melittangium boletus]ATB32293.1 hypothetical protein MEBOL_005770 [Melittangium boletus DSM 14713]